MGGMRTATFWFSAALATLLVACADEPAPPPARSPETVSEFFEALESGLSQDSGLYHIRLSTKVQATDVEQDFGTVDAWIDIQNDRARWEFTVGPDNTADIADHWIAVYAEGARYFKNLEDNADPVTRRSGQSLRSCFPGATGYLLSVIACGLVAETTPEGIVTLERSSFDGKPSLALVLTSPFEQFTPPQGVPPPPGGWPTPEPIYAAATIAEMAFHIDASTFLPVAVTYSIDSDPDHSRYGGEIRFEGEFVEKSELPKDAYSPEALGYVTPKDEELQKLEDPGLQTPVYWLGRTFDPGAGLPVLRDLYVNSYGPRPSRGDEPNIQLGLAYRANGGFVRLDIYPPGDWEAFKARLGGNFPWSWCGDSREFTTGDAVVTILAAHESFPYNEFEAAQPGLATPGQQPPAPAPPTIPPLKTEPCPATPHDRFMAEVRFPDATVVINGTLRYGGQDGKTFGIFDTDAALELIARGLRLRNPGE